MASSRDDAPDAPDGPGGTATPGVRSPRVAVIGAGPSGIFAAQALVSRSDDRVDVYDRLPAPYGLLRYGVAPDHTSIKGVATALARVFDDDRVSFVGMVELGVDVTAGELLEAYDAVIYAAGASEDQRMRIPGEDLPGSRSAREVVAWYSGHPDAVTQSFAGVTTAVMVGVGNVAVDVARILLKTASQLASTDMPTDVLAELRDHHITDVWVVGRRGPHHASFTTVELRELLAIPGVQPIVHPGAFDGIDEAGLDRRTRGNVEPLREAAGRAPRAGPALRAGAARHRLPGQAVAGAALRRRARRRPQRGRTGHRSRGARAPGPLRGGVDQAGADGRHRHQQVRRGADRRAPAR